MVIVYYKGEMNAVTTPVMTKEAFKEFVNKFPEYEVSLMNTKLEFKKAKGFELSFEEVKCSLSDTTQS